MWTKTKMRSGHILWCCNTLWRSTGTPSGPHSASLPVRDRLTNMTPLCLRHVNQHQPI
ncbi:hypothetical protein ID866_12890 [Astraeus odoratus]|nr:hypothetical protein ID866_12890 [Astraeus odoratus]